MKVEVEMDGPKVVSVSSVDKEVVIGITSIKDEFVGKPIEVLCVVGSGVATGSAYYKASF